MDLHKAVIADFGETGLGQRPGWKIQGCHYLNDLSLKAPHANLASKFHRS
jgi:hypothetical protein